MRNYVFAVCQAPVTNDMRVSVSRVFFSLASAEKYRHDMFDDNSEFIGWIELLRVYE